MIILIFLFFFSMPLAVIVVVFLQYYVNRVSAVSSPNSVILVFVL